VRPEDEQLAGYLFGFYGSLLSDDERRALRVIGAEVMSSECGDPTDDDVRRRAASEDPGLERMLAHGVDAFRAGVCERLLREHGDAIYLNRCPKCGALARTPRACLCPSCSHTWFELRAASGPRWDGRR